MNKLKSRKFWLSTAAFLGSIGASVAGMCTDNSVVTVFGLICTTISAGIYAGAEAYVDAAKKLEKQEEKVEE